MNIVQNIRSQRIRNPSGLHRSVEKKNASLLPLHPVRDASLQDARGRGAMPVSTDRCIPLGCVLTSTKYTHYCGNYVFETGVDDKLLTDNGYYSGGKYYFYSKDYLGNIVATVRVDSIGHNASVVQATHYYPFGLPMAISTGANVQKYKYSGKEFDTEHGLMEYDFGARTHDAQTGRFMTVDPLAENYYNVSPYAYCLNNPVNYKDPTGMWIVGIDGKPVTFVKGQWSNNASADVQRIGNAMMGTHEGKKVFANMSNAKYGITMNYKEGFSSDNRDRLGEAKIHYRENLKTGEKTVTSAEINLFDGKIKENIAQYKQGNIILQPTQKDNILKELQPTLTERIGQVGVHEGTHATDPSAMPFRVGTDNAEKTAVASEMRYINQTVRPLSIDSKMFQIDLDDLLKNIKLP